MNKIQDSAAFVFITATLLLAGLSILGVWEIVMLDVIYKALQTLGLLALVAVIIMIAAKFMDRSGDAAEATPPAVNPAFTSIRHGTLGLLIVSATLLALLGILAIWEVMATDILYRSLSTVSILGFTSLIVVMVCLNRERHAIIQRAGKGMSVGSIIVMLIVGYILLAMLFGGF